jgi:hypothetical protein
MTQMTRTTLTQVRMQTPMTLTTLTLTLAH